MKRLLVSLNARYVHKAPAVWMLREACLREGLAVDVLERDISTPPNTLLREICNDTPDFIGFSCNIINIRLVERITAALRRALPNSYIAWGGPEVSLNPEEHIVRLKQDAPDCILCGEGEEALPILLLQLAKGENLPQILRAAPVRPENWIHLYQPGTFAEGFRLHYIETARGCPFSCAYCMSGAEKTAVRALPADEAAQRILQTRDAGAETIKLLDRTFNFDARRARSIWQTLIEKGSGATYHFEIAAHLLTDEDLSLLARAPQGLFQFEIGVQSLNPQTLRRINRSQNFEILSRNVRRLREADNIQLHLDLIAGLPAETYETFAYAVDETLALRPHMLQLGFLKLLPGSPLRTEYDCLGFPYDPYPPYEVIATDTLSIPELTRLHDIEEILSSFVFSPHLSLTSQRYLHSFAAMEAVAQKLRAEGYFDRRHSVEERFDALWRVLPKDAATTLLADFASTKIKLTRPWARHL